MYREHEYRLQRQPREAFVKQGGFLALQQISSDGLSSSGPPRFSQGLRRVSCASLPRSGHHMLQQILSSYFGTRHRYCQYYDGPFRRSDCCNAFPCTNPDVNFQKSHDLNLDSNQAAGQFYLVQYRHPLKAAISSFEEGLTYDKNMKDTHEYWVRFAKESVLFAEKFMQRWIIDSDLQNVLMVEYDEFLRSPLLQISRVIRFIEPEVIPDPMRIIDVINSWNIVSDQRNMFSFRYFDLAYFIELENSIAEVLHRVRLPNLVSTPTELCE